MKICLHIFFFLIYIGNNCLNAQQHAFRLMCYNVENYFDCIDDPLTHDEEFLPDGMRRWTYTRYKEKQTNIAKVIAHIGAWEPPAIVGLCEVESRKAMYDLVLRSPLKNLRYKFIHHESPDFRGIDVAMLYQSDIFQVLHDEAIAVKFKDAPHRTTRDILYVMGEIKAPKDTLHLFICHFPSRLGGEMESESKRCDAAEIMRRKVDEIFENYHNPNIVIMGDFNDYPDNKSILNYIQAGYPREPCAHANLYNLMYPLHIAGKGTHKYQADWGVLDHLIVSGSLLDKSSSLFTDTTAVHIFDADYLLQDDEKFLGKKPFRTYVGMKYIGGYSDHLPVYMDFFRKE